MAGDRIRVLVVDDSAVIRRALSRFVESDPRLELVGTASNGLRALEMIADLHPDVVTLDIEMPSMDGLSTLARIRFDIKPPKPAVLMCSSLTHEGSHEALKALRLGAADVIAKQSSRQHASGADQKRFEAEYLGKILTIARHRSQRAAMTTEVQPTRRPSAASSTGKAPPGETTPSETTTEPPQRTAPTVAKMVGRPKLVVIGSSTGGPPAIERALIAIPRIFPAPIVIAQHMPAMFTRSLSERLAQACEIEVRHAGETIDRLKPGAAYLVEGGMQGHVGRARGGGLRLEINQEPADARYAPSVDVLFESAASLGPDVLGIVLTGMGDDGLAGAKQMNAKGAKILTQSAESCVVYGMPRAIDQAELSLASLDPDSLGLALALTCRDIAERGRDVA
ncbi:MAG: chemotaxis-specific protein-glutamate methyltransferase CheB [Planctomycetota bacterium]